uniref:DUF6986 family protein n=1 Tax=Nocardia abscessus TaxID=120957 RepID=UPI003CC80211
MKVPENVRARIESTLDAVDAELRRRYPGSNGRSQPIHTVYVPADRVAEETPGEWGATGGGVVRPPPQKQAPPDHTRTRAHEPDQGAPTVRIVGQAHHEPGAAAVAGPAKLTAHPAP